MFGYVKGPFLLSTRVKVAGKGMCSLHDGLYKPQHNYCCQIWLALWDKNCNLHNVLLTSMDHVIMVRCIRAYEVMNWIF